MNKKVLLMILDGWGITKNPDVSAINKAKTPFIDSLYTQFANAQLRTDGKHVGLPEGQMGNSEVGHMNLGAGRIVYQSLAKIDNSIRQGRLAKEKQLLKAFEYARENDKNIHFMGLLSDGGIHSHIAHLKGLLDATAENNLEKVFVHAFTDGRDSDPKSGIGFVSDIQDYMQKTVGQLASVTGRYYAMDRDNRWQRTQLAYDALVHGTGIFTDDVLVSMQDSYDKNITDEFIKPLILTNQAGNPKAVIGKGDVVIFYNFRADRARQLTKALSQDDFTNFKVKKDPLYFVSMTNYDDTFKDIHVIYPSENIKNTLGEILEKAGKKQIRIAETEKYPHVTFFFSAGRETPFAGEKRLLCPSPKVATYDLKPQMSAYQIRDAIIPELNREAADFICLNFANADMVGHTGVFEAAIKACETLDECVKEVVNIAMNNKYTTILIADHGNCETMLNPDGTPNTAHTTNPVPIILIDKEITRVKNGILANIAPTVLHLMGIKKPKEMTLDSLL